MIEYRMNKKTKLKKKKQFDWYFSTAGRLK